MKVNFTTIENYPAPLRLGIFIFCLLLLWLPLAIPLYLLLKDDPNLTTIVTMGVLYLEFVGLLFIWNKTVYNISNWWQVYGLVFTRKNGIELLNGLSIGLLFTFSLFGLEAILGWVNFVQPSASLIRIVFEGLLSALAIGLAEELFFRGWLLEELKRDYSLKIVVFSNAIIFATLHFLKPLEEIIRTFPQFPALVLLGFTLVLAKWGQGNRLGICIGLHGGLVWGYYILNVGKLFNYTGKVSPIITGIDNNPIAGVMGLIFLGILSFLMSKKFQNTGKI
ncbi:CPBP family intramembrane glutamic endopeptidase [Crocosphaera sp. XPORK-15E]|uniref:CPBP family intramembrane glutamic endopeptidase n=1 Tax=Crocosphaera sp. XPORK-15E TaxID=3110247 RepID=UPI002B20AF08|nr:CPBP family intramembrane glutamic endopeptidase [Crocosphaera sp. XPORK-15E]MEA5534010.1 CPBP family intramembrane glutamic endopeptidase [Crocosphaera sp. XPORK-15E]